MSVGGVLKGNIVDYDIVAPGGIDIVDQIMFIPSYEGEAKPILNPYFTDWSDFDFVEFDMWFDEKPSTIYFRTSDNEKIPDSATLDLEKYSTNIFIHLI